jgi:hypothetical protein
VQPLEIIILSSHKIQHLEQLMLVIFRQTLLYIYIVLQHRLLHLRLHLRHLHHHLLRWTVLLVLVIPPVVLHTRQLAGHLLALMVVVLTRFVIPLLVVLTTPLSQAVLVAHLRLLRLLQLHIRTAHLLGIAFYHLVIQATVPVLLLHRHLRLHLRHLQLSLDVFVVDQTT